MVRTHLLHRLPDPIVVGRRSLGGPNPDQHGRWERLPPPTVAAQDVQMRGLGLMFFRLLRLLFLMLG